ncbi:MAG: hypothetical protein PHQ40_11265, partial [Anaerolineaceae bacterium]|nr:hypothetical protein [Anaerolineaceae bacterium]
LRLTLPQNIYLWLRSTWTALYTSTPPAGFAWLPRTWAAALYLLGVAFWSKFLNWGAIPFDFHDWAEISAARVAFVRDALTQGVLPLHMISSAWLRTLTDRYFVLPDVISSPQMVLLWFLQTGPFILVSTVLMYTLGVIGLLWMRRKFSLSPVAFTLLFFLFNFNGHVQAHLAVGHVNWAGNFLFPWLLVLSIQLLDRPQGWRWVAATASLLFLLLLNGSFHQFVWSLFFLGLLGIAAYRRLFTVLKALILGGLLSAVRLLPPTLELGHFSNEFISGYPNLSVLASSLIGLRSPLRAYQTRLMYNGVGYWELDLYVGIAGALLLLYFGVFYWVRNNLRGRQYPQLFLPTAGLLLFSLGTLYEPFMSIPFPLINAERVSSRMVILPFLVVSLFAAVNFQAFLDQAGQLLEVQLGSLGALLYFGRDLLRHFLAWQVTQVSAVFPYTRVDLARNLVGNHADPPYTNVLMVGLLITVATGVFLFLAVRHELRTKRLITGHAAGDSSAHSE